MPTPLFPVQGDAEAKSVALEELVLAEAQVVGHEVAAELQPQQEHEAGRGEGPAQALDRHERAAWARLRKGPSRQLPGRGPNL